MALKSKLGFGMMRLPLLSEDPTDFDYEQLNEMVDRFLDAGFTYFDTSYVYHKGKSEEAVRKAVVERHPRDSFTIATKFPTFNLKPGDEDKIEAIFQEQLDRLGVDYIDYYLIHNIQTVWYDGYDGKGGVAQTEHLFEHAEKWLADGKIRHLGFSFHSSPELLERVLNDHPNIEFVQIPLNYLDWNSKLVRTGEQCEIIRRHGKKVVVMQPVKGGGLAKVPDVVEKVLKEKAPDQSIASWAIRFIGSLDGLVCTLSGMSNLEQVDDNINTYLNSEPLTEAESKWLREDINELYRSAGKYGTDLSKYEGLTLYGADVTAIMEAYNNILLQPDVNMADENNYLKNVIAQNAHLDFHEDLPKQTLINKDGEDVTEEVYEAYEFLRVHTF